MIFDFYIAHKIGHTELEVLALKFLKSALNSRCILVEIFSPITARYEKLQRIELDFLLLHWSELQQPFMQRLSTLSTEDLAAARWLMPKFAGRVIPHILVPFE